MPTDDSDIILKNEGRNINPRSKLVEAILVLLLARPLRTSEIASNLGLETKYVSSYLSYWKRKGLVYQEAGRWHLSAQGEDLAKEILESKNDTKFKEYLAIARDIFNEKVKSTMNNKSEKKINKDRKEILSFIEAKTSTNNNKPQKEDLINCLGEIINKLDDDERELLIFLLTKYSQWGSTYVYLDQLQEEFSADPGWLFRVLRNLQTKRLLYLYHDPKLGLRIGFTKTLKDRISEC
mgnify:CR=1 FL=1